MDNYGRRNNTKFGLEWALGPSFYERYGSFFGVQSCKTSACIAEWSAQTGLDYQYLVVQKSGVDKELIRSLDQAYEYDVIYSTKEVLIYSLQKP
jgi:hypothetical protein